MIAILMIESIRRAWIIFGRIFWEITCRTFETALVYVPVVCKDML